MGTPSDAPDGAAEDRPRGPRARISDAPRATPGGARANGRLRGLSGRSGDAVGHACGPWAHGRPPGDCSPARPITVRQE